MVRKDGYLKLVNAIIGENRGESMLPIRGCDILVIDELVASFGKRKQGILRMRFGLRGKILTLREIGEIFNVSKESIRQQEMGTLRKLRHPSRARTFKLLFYRSYLENTIQRQKITIDSLHEQVKEFEERQKMEVLQKKFGVNLVAEVGVDVLELSVRAARCLRKSGISTLGVLCQKTQSDLLSIPGFGRKSVNEIREELR